MRNLKTEKCIVCGNKSTNWHGYVIAKERMGLGNYIDKKIIAGFCEVHNEKYIRVEDGCYGNYNSQLMGKCVPLFENRH